jgi:hypothetical protein
MGLGLFYKKIYQDFIYPNRSNLEVEIKEKPVHMTVAGTMSYTGKLWNLTGQFSNEEFYFTEGSTKPHDNLFAVLNITFSNLSEISESYLPTLACDNSLLNSSAGIFTNGTV